MKLARGDGRRVLLALPAVGFVAVLVAALFGLSARPVRSAQVFSGPSGDGPITGRVLVVEEEGTLTRPVADVEVTVAVFVGALAHETMVRTAADGVADFSLAAFPTTAISHVPRIVVSSSNFSDVLVEGPFEPRSDAYRRAGRRGGRVSLRSKEGDRLDVLVERGVLAVPFEGTVEVRAAPPWALSAAKFRASARGASLRGSPEFLLSPEHPAELRLVPEEHVVELTLDAELPDGTHRLFSGYLPVVPGAFGVEFEGPRARILSPVPRAEAFFTLLSEGRRVASGRVPLRERADGVAEGTLDLSTFARSAGEGLFLVLGTDADGRSPSTVGYPLVPYGATLDAVDDRIVDGRERALATERRRSGRVRLGLLLYVAFVFVTTIVLFVRFVRREAKRVRESLERSGVDPGTVSPGGFVYLAAFVLVFGMSAALVWAALVRPF